MEFFTALGLGTYLIIVILYYVLLVIADWKIFSKAGEGGWKSLIPIYNIYITYKISGNKTAFWFTAFAFILAGILNGQDGSVRFLGGVCALVALILLIIELFKLSKVFGHGFWFGLGLILFPNIFSLILGFGKSRYIGYRN